jgi:DNA adenine methylase
VKWAGGKRQLINILLKNIPSQYNMYLEPFVGAGALLFALSPKHAIVSDINPEIINAYLVIKNNVKTLISSLRKHINTENYFYRIRSKDPKRLSQVQRASRFIYLNRTCFNGLYRENSKGEFNVPFGNYKKPKILDKENLVTVSDYLNSNKIKILCRDYKKTVSLAKQGDFVYFDPPYHPFNATSSFTKYSKGDFTEKDQIELSQIFRELDNKGCYVMLSNSNTKFIRNLYRGYNIRSIAANRAINCKAERRGKGLYEVLVKNYK